MARVEGKLRILFLSQRFILPMDTGGKIRTGKILEHLNGWCDITLVSNIDESRDPAHLKGIERLCSRFIGVPKKEIARYSSRFYLDVLIKSFSHYPIKVLNDSDPALARTIRNAVKKYGPDLLVCDFVQSALNVPSVCSTKSLLLQHNAESLLTKRHVEHSRGLARAFWHLQWKKMERFERLAYRGFDGVVSVSRTEASYLRSVLGLSRVYEIPTGVDTRFFVPGTRSAESVRLVFVGSLDWLPNEDAMLYFVTDVFWRVRRDVPKAKLSVVGRYPSRRLLAVLRRIPGIEVTGWVPDTRPHVQRSAVFIVPIRIGGGTRIKIYEAMAMGLPVVSTSVGAEGLPVVPGENIELADGPQHFARVVVELLRNPERRWQLGDRAREFVVRNARWEQVAQDFHEACWRVAHSRD